MTCQQARDEYIESVRNVVELTRHITEIRTEYIGLLKDRAFASLVPNIDEWRICIESMERLIAEERASMAAYRDAAATHDEPPVRH
jgi:hypothetical protein